jgi:aminoglycoside phosphotransferase (APT) family kinase protein
MRELPRSGIPTPHLLGLAHDREHGAILVQWIEAATSTPKHRLDVCRALATLHCVELSALSSEFQELILESDPKPERCSPIWHLRLLDERRRDWRTQHAELATAAEEWVRLPLPPIAAKTLVHGDCFSANFIATCDEVRIIDWETLGLGDPMWDLAILLNADRGLSDAEIESCLKVYSAIRPIDEQRLKYYSAGWQLRWKMAALLS